MTMGDFFFARGLKHSLARAHVKDKNVTVYTVNQLSQGSSVNHHSYRGSNGGRGLHVKRWEPVLGEAVLSQLPMHASSHICLPPPLYVYTNNPPPQAF